GVQINGIPKQALTHKLDVKDCVETIKEWGKVDRSKLVSLIEALKQLEFDSEGRGEDGSKANPRNHHDEGVLITTLKSLDPRVPEFQSFRIAEAKNKTDKVEETERHQSAKCNLNSFPESDCNKENIPEVPVKP